MGGLPGSCYGARMRQLSFVLLVAGSLAVVGPQAQEDYPHAFPRAGVTKLVDNERINVWEVNWITGVKQPIHRHRYDMAGVYLRYGPITVTRPDGTANPPSAPFEIPAAVLPGQGRHAPRGSAQSAGHAGASGHHGGLEGRTWRDTPDADRRSEAAEVVPPRGCEERTGAA